MSRGSDSWGERLLGFAVSALAAVLILNFAWDATKPVRPVLFGATVVYGYLKWQGRMR